MKINMNNELGELRKSVWSLTREALENIKATLEKLDISALESLQGQVEVINSLPSKVQASIDRISNLQETKVDKVEGKQLSTNDFTTEEKIKLATLGSGSSGGEIPEGVVVDKNYVHTDNNYTSAEKTKLAGIEEGADKTVLPENLVTDANYVHTDNNFTDTQKTKLAGIEEGANKTVLPNNIVTDSGYVHTDNNFTLSYRIKLEGIEAGATKNILPDYIVSDQNYVHTDCNFTVADKQKLLNIEEGANKYILPSDVAKTNQIKTYLSEMIDDNYHRVVTDKEKLSWNAKADNSSLAAIAKTGAFTDLVGCPIENVELVNSLLIVTLPTSDTAAEE